MGTKASEASQAYIFDEAQAEREYRRLQALELRFDPATCRRLLAAGGLAGKRCLEVGAGAGSIARWLVGQVGDQGSVVALDTNTRFLRNLEGAEVIERGLQDAKLPPGSFDLVHARYVAIHNADSAELLDQMRGCLAPGGLLVLEEPDFRTARSVLGPPELSARFERVNAAILALFEGRGMDPGLGAKLPELLQARRLQVELIEEDLHLERGASPLALMMAMSTEQLADNYIATGRASADDIQGYLEFSRSPASFGVYYSTVAVMCRRAG